MEETRKDRIQLLVRRICLIITDILLVNGCVFLSLLMRFEISISAIPEEYLLKYQKNMIPFTIVAIIIFWCFRMYHSLWQYASIAELYKIVEACIVTEFAHICVTAYMGWMLPRSCYFTSGVFLIVAMSASRFMYRMIRTVLQNYRHTAEQVRIMIIGAGEATNVLMREIQNSRYMDNSKVVCIIDDDTQKVGKYIRGVKVVGTRNKIKEVAKVYDIDEIIFAIPSASMEDKRNILNICKETDCNLKILPGVYQMVDGEINVNSIRSVDVLDLLGRDPIEVDLDSIMGYVKDKTILVTGGGGSIGSELCRQLVSHKPKCLIIFDIYENNAYEIQQELKMTYPDANVVTLIGSIRNISRLESVFAQYRPEIVYHAAAHKHVPLMEDSPNEAVKNNVVGTWNVAKMADKYGVGKFVMISTDKAVNPTNVMGASKRLAEMYVQSLSIAISKGRHSGKTRFITTRFGNVLGSNGSVIPRFREQLAKGGPLTVTHPDIIRYFMTIPEACRLVLEAAFMGKGNEVFVFDMGTPVKIANLARRMIELAGLIPGEDIEIKYTGLRPGEKLYEELLATKENTLPTENEKIYRAQVREYDYEDICTVMSPLIDLAIKVDKMGTVRMMKGIVPEFKSKNSVYEALDKAE